MFPLIMFFIACEERQFLYLDLVKKHQVLNYKHHGKITFPIAQ